MTASLALCCRRKSWQRQKRRAESSKTGGSTLGIRRNPAPRRLLRSRRGASMKAWKCPCGLWNGQARIMALCNESHMPTACPSTGTSYVERSRHAPGKRHRNGATMTKVCRVIPDSFQYVRNDRHVVLQPGSYLHWCLHRRRRRLMYCLRGVSPCLTPMPALC